MSQKQIKILVLNSGSSSQKACLYEIGDSLPNQPPACLWEGRIEWNGQTAVAAATKASGGVQKKQVAGSSRGEILRDLLSSIWSGDGRVIGAPSEIHAAGHRIVHGGGDFKGPVVISPDVYSAIHGMSAFAPLHIQPELEDVRTVKGLLGDIRQIAVFDTGFHSRMPLSAAVYPGPYEWFENGIRRYGFHGINHQYCAGRAGQLLGKEPETLKVVTCHLGNGCSVAAVDGNRSVDTTMGFTPLDGLMMGTRSGAIDPGILTFLMRQDQLNGDDIDTILNQKSGLLGISGISGDMRDILSAIQEGHQRAKLAFDIYVHRLRLAIGGMAAVLGGMDALVFTAGVGENSPEVRAAACATLEFLGVRLNDAKNANPHLDADISASESRVRVLAIRAEEDWAIAAECWKLTRESQQ